MQSTSLEAFNAVFSNYDTSTIKDKVLWLKMGDNKMPNKKSVSDLIEVLITENLIQSPSNLPKVLSSCFTFTTGDSKFTHSNLVKDDDYSFYRLDFEKIVKSLQHLIG